MIPEFESLLNTMRPEKMRTVALASAIDVAALQSLSVAYQMGFVRAILCGDESEIKSVAQKNNIDISAFEIVHCADELSSAQMAVSLVRNGRADILMKGLIHTADILRAVLNRETGIRGDGILSHVSVLYSPLRNRRFYLTDCAMVMYPTLEQKVDLIKNAVSFARGMGCREYPLVATLCAVETLNPAMQATVDAAALKEMNKSGLLRDCILSGPISFDLAVSPDAVRAKGYRGFVAGDADILVFHNIEAGNSTLKSMVQFGDFIFGGVILGARAPIVINSRSDSDISKLFSIACACRM
jgi:phosphotransacetylase